jgi:hypothetical protein
MRLVVEEATGFGSAAEDITLRNILLQRIFRVCIIASRGFLVIQKENPPTRDLASFAKIEASESTWSIMPRR